jgi:hypothetical protein
MKNSKYSWIAKNTGRDNIYATRIKLIQDKNINVKNSTAMYIYYMKALLGIILLDYKDN